MTPDQLRDLLADNAAEVDETVTGDVANAYRARVQALLGDPTARDPDLWEDAFEAVGIDHGWAVFTMYELVTDFMPVERDLTWQMARATVQAAAEDQAFAELVARDLLTVSEQHAAKVKRAGKATVKAVAKTGISKDRFRAAKERRNGRPA